MTAFRDQFWFMTGLLLGLSIAILIVKHDVVALVLGGVGLALVALRMLLGPGERAKS